MGRVITLEARGFDASADVWKFAKDAYGSITKKKFSFFHTEEPLFRAQIPYVYFRF